MIKGINEINILAKDISCECNVNLVVEFVIRIKVE